MQRDDSSSQRSTTDDFLEAASAEGACQDIELFKWVFATAHRAVNGMLAGSVGFGDVEDLAAKSTEKFYLKFDFSGLARLAIDHRRKRLFHFLNVMVARTVVDYWRGKKEGREQQLRLPLIEISKEQLPQARSAIRQLPRSDRELIDLKLVRDLTYPEVQNYYAGPRKKPPSISALKTRMHRIMEKLRAGLSA